MPTLEEELRRAELEYERARANTVRTTTDENGHYVFEDVPDRKWFPEAHSEGYIIKHPTVQQYAVIGTTLDLTAFPVMNLPIEVLSESGALMPSALIVCQDRISTGPPKTYVWDQLESSLRLPPGSYQLTAYPTETAEAKLSRLRSDTQAVELKVGAEPSNMRLQLHRSLGISGRVHVTPGELETELAYISLIQLEPGQEPQLEILAKSKQRAHAYPGSLYHFVDLDPGRYALGFKRHYSAEISDHVVLELSSESLTHDFELGKIDTSKLVELTALDPDGIGLTGRLQCSLHYVKLGSLAYFPVQALGRGNGLFLLEFNEEATSEYFKAPTAESRFDLRVKHPILGSRELRLSPGQKRAEIRFEPSASLVVEVDGFSPSEFEGRLRVVAVGSDSSIDVGRETGKGQVNSDGSQVLTNLPPSSHKLALKVLARNAPAHGWYAAPIVDTAEVLLESGANQARLRIPDGHSLQVHWESVKPGTIATLRRVDGDSPPGRSASGYFGEDGVAHFEFLVEGQYHLLVSSEGKLKSQNVSIPSGLIELGPS